MSPHIKNDNKSPWKEIIKGCDDCPIDSLLILPFARLKKVVAASLTRLGNSVSTLSPSAGLYVLLKSTLLTSRFGINAANSYKTIFVKFINFSYSCVYTRLGAG